MNIYYCKNELDYKKAILDIFVNSLEFLDIDSSLSASKIAVCKYAIDASIDSEDGQIDSCQNCDIDECFLWANVNSKNIYKNFYISDMESVMFPCMVCQGDRDDLTICSLEAAKNNTKYGARKNNW